MRWLTLYVRSRGVPASAAALTAGTAATWSLSQLAADPRVRLTLTVLAMLVGAAAIAPGLAGADPALDRTAAVGWPPRRAGHLVAAAAAVAGVIGVATMVGKPMADAAVVARGAVGLAGLVGLAAVILGTGRAWLLPVGWTAVVLMRGADGGTWYARSLTWIAQPAGTSAAAVTAGVLGAAGALAYALFGAADR